MSNTDSSIAKSVDIVLNATIDKEVEKYCYMWKEGGQFSKKI